MTAPWYDASGYPGTGGSGSSASMRAELLAIEAAFDKLPSFTGKASLPVFVNAAETALETLSAVNAATALGLGTGSSPTFTGLTLTGNFSVQGNTSLGNAAADTLTIASNAVTWTNGCTHSGAHTFSGTITNTALTGGTINNASVGASTRASGAFTAAAIGAGVSASVGLKMAKADLTGTTQYGITSDFAGTSGATSEITGVWAGPSTAAAAFTCTNLYDFYAFGTAKGAGSTITNSHGFYAADRSSGTNNYAFRGAVSAGANKWNTYNDGNARNFMAGKFQIGNATEVSTGYALEVDSFATAAIFKNTGATAGTPVLDVQHIGTTGDNVWLRFFTEVAGTERGSMDFNRAGGLARFNTTSDEDLKIVHGDADRAVSCNLLQATRIREYSWREDPTRRQIGVIAQEVYEGGFRGAVSPGGDYYDGEGVKRHRPWGVDKTAWNFHLIAGWQDHDARIKQLEQQMRSMR